MPRSALPPAILSRRATLALLAGALLARPGIARAQGRTFTHTYSFGFDLPAAEGEGRARLQLHVAADGSAQARGTVHLPEAEPPAVLVATGEAQAVFAGGGLAGLTLLLRRPSPPASCCHVAGDISFDAPVGPSGTYRAVVGLVDTATGETILRTEVEVELYVADYSPGAANAAAQRKRRAKGGTGRRGKRRR